MPDENGVGEIAVTTSSCAFGYLGESSDGVKSPPRYETGDFGKFNESGDLLILGRKSRIINRGGLKVSPEEIEREVMSLGVVQDVVVLAASEIRSVATNVDSIVGIVVLKEGQDQAETEKALSQGLLKNLSPHKVPGTWLAWDSIPRRANGKLDMPAIRQKFGSCKNSV
jgi:o-succinylbenzoate---CoA ligase